MTFTEMYDAWATYETYYKEIELRENLCKEIIALIKDDWKNIKGLYNNDFPGEVEEFMGCLNNNLFDAEFTEYAQDKIHDMLKELSWYADMSDNWDFDDDEKIEQALEDCDNLRSQIFDFFSDNYDHPTIEDLKAADENE